MSLFVACVVDYDLLAGLAAEMEVVAMSGGDRGLVRELLRNARSGTGSREALLVLADWLEEHDDPRGVFVRLQVLAADLPLAEPRRARMQAEAVQLRLRHERSWLGALPEVLIDWRFVNGLLDVEVPLAQFVHPRMVPVLESEPWAWAREVIVQVGRKSASLLAESPHLAHLSSLSLRYNRIGAAGAATLAQSPHLANLSSLDLRNNDIGDAGAKAVAQSPHLSNLSSLDLGGNTIGDEGAAALAQSPHLANLHSLRLFPSDIGAARRKLLQDRFGQALG